MKICFVIAAMGPGGAERVASILCNHWVGSGHAVKLITFNDSNISSHYKLDSRIEILALNLLSLDHSLPMLVKENTSRIMRLREIFSREKPDVIISFMTTANILTILANIKLGFPLVISERVHPGYHDMGRLRSFLRARFYRYADRIVVQTADIADWMKINLGLKSDVMPNPIELDYFDNMPEQKKCPQDGAEHIMVSIGRLDRQKGHDITISAFARISAKYPNWKLQIYGEGPEREKLNRLIAASSLQDKVELKGVVDDVRVVLANSDLFVLSSRYEGFPNALIEALACSCCVIASNCHGASHNILQGGLYGKLVEPENIEELASTMEELISSHDQRHYYSTQARHAVTGFSAGNISQQWLDLILSLSQTGRIN